MIEDIDKELSSEELCDCYYAQMGIDNQSHGVCYGTRERDICDCKGEKRNCNFYPNTIKKEGQALYEKRNKTSDSPCSSVNQRQECESNCYDNAFASSTEITFERYAQRMEINIKDMATVLTVLMSVGYECRVFQDGETMSIVIIEFVNPTYSGHHFDETND